MIRVNNFKDLYKLKSIYSNKYILYIIEKTMNLILLQSVENEETFNLDKIIEGNGSLIICENNEEINYILNLIENDKYKLVWCIKSIVQRDTDKTFYQIGLIKNKQYCLQYLMEINHINEKLIERLEDITTSLCYINS